MLACCHQQQLETGSGNHIERTGLPKAAEPCMQSRHVLRCDDAFTLTHLACKELLESLHGQLVGVFKGAVVLELLLHSIIRQVR